MNTTHHAAACQCWQCRVNAGEPVALQEYRTGKVDPTVCAHPADSRSPCSGWWLAVRRLRGIRAFADRRARVRARQVGSV